MEELPCDQKVAADLCFSSPEVLPTSVAAQKERKGQKEGMEFKINLPRKIRYFNFNAISSYEKTASHLCGSHCTNSIAGPSPNALRIQQRGESILMKLGEQCDWQAGKQSASGLPH